MKVLAAALAVLAALSPARAQERVWEAVYPEGPIWIEDRLYWAEMQAHNVGRLGPSGPEVFASVPGCGPTSVAPRSGGRVAVLCHFDRSVWVLDASGKIESRHDRTPDDLLLRNPNDSFAGPDGLWFTDPGRFSSRAQAEGRLYHLGDDGILSLHDEGLFYGNGVFHDVAAGRLLVSEHLARRVLSYPLGADGLGAPRVLIDLDALGLAPSGYPEAGPDGLEVAPDGTLWVAEYGAGRLIAWRDGSGLVGHVPVPAQFVTNIAFSADGKVAITGSFENTRPRNRGAVWLTTADVLVSAIRN